MLNRRERPGRRFRSDPESSPRRDAPIIDHSKCYYYKSFKDAYLRPGKEDPDERFDNHRIEEYFGESERMSSVDVHSNHIVHRSTNSALIEIITVKNL